MWSLFVADIKMLLRNKQALFWSLAFPLLFLLVFGLFVGGDQDITFSIAIFDESDTELSHQIVTTFEGIEVFDVTHEYVTIEDAQSAIGEGDLRYALVLPESMANIQTETPHKAMLYVDEQQTQYNQIVHGVIKDVLTTFNFGITDTPQLFSVEEQGLIAKEVSYFDFIMMGILGMGLMTSAIIGMTTGIVNYREKKILKRLLATPIKRWQFVTAEILSFVLLAFAQAALILIFGVYVFGGHIFGSIPLIFLLVFLGVGVFLGFAFALSGMVSTVRAAEGLSNGIATPMMFLSGVFFPIENLPTVVAVIVKYLPLTPLLKAFRAVGLEEKGITDISQELLILGAWFIIVFVIAVSTFRFEKR